MNLATPTTLEQVQVKADYEKGLRLQDTLHSAGWPDVLDIMEKEVIQAEFALMNYNGTDDAALFSLHRRARTMREFFQQTQRKIIAAVDAIAEITNADTNPDLVGPVNIVKTSW
jgi:hypothetical protein